MLYRSDVGATTETSSTPIIDSARFLLAGVKTLVREPAVARQTIRRDCPFLRLGAPVQRQRNVQRVKQMITPRDPAASATPDGRNGSLTAHGGAVAEGRTDDVQTDRRMDDLARKLDLGNSIERAKQEWEITVDSLPQLVCVLDRQGRVVRANRTVERWHLANVSEVRGMTLDELLHGHCEDTSCYLKTLMPEAMTSAKRGRRSRCQVEDPVLQLPLEIVVLPALVSREQTQAREIGEFAVVTVDDVSAIKRTEAALRQSESELHLLSSQLLTAQEMERKRIASELHDSIGASLSGIKFGLEQAIQSMPAGEFEQSRTMLRSLVQMMKDTMGEVRRISMDLRPASLDDLGLIATLSWFFREFGVIHPHLRVVKDVDVREAEVTPSLKTVIFRVVQEGVNNVVKHAGSDELRLRLKRRGREIELVLEDRGCGFDPAAVLPGGEGSMRGFGLNTMRERVEMSGGTFSLTSRPGAGTRLQARWPLRDAARS